MVQTVGTSSLVTSSNVPSPTPALPVAPVGKWGSSPLLAAARLLITATAAVGAITASFVFLRTLGAETGWPGRSALLLPLSVDALAAGAWLAYWSAGDPTARRFAGRVGAGATVASLLGNGLSHLLVTGAVEPSAWLVAIIGGVPAVSLALVVRLSVPGLTGVGGVGRRPRTVGVTASTGTRGGVDGPGSATAPDSGGGEIGYAADATTDGAPPAETAERQRRGVTRTGDSNTIRREPGHGHVRRRSEVPAAQEGPRVGIQRLVGPRREEGQEREQVGEEERQRQEEVAPTGRAARATTDTLIAALPAELLARPTASGIRKALGVGTGRAAELRDLIAAGHHVNGQQVNR